MASPTSTTSPPTYENLTALDSLFTSIDTRILSTQHILSQPLYTKRRATLQRIPNFWPIALEQAPAEIDQFILPSDSEVLASLVDVWLERPEVPDALPKEDVKNGDDVDVDVEAYGEPRTFTLTFTFAPNDFLTDTSLTKTFRYRRSKDNQTALVSDPVKINWKKGKDLTHGLLNAAYNLYIAQQKTAKESQPENRGEEAHMMDESETEKLPEYEALNTKIEAAGSGAQSFFTFFGYRGPWISDEESVEANRKHLENMRKHNGLSSPSGAAEGQEDSQKQETQEESEEEEEDLDPPMPLSIQTEIFPEGEELATVIAEDFWPGAIRYFVAAQEAELVSDSDEFSDEDDRLEVDEEVDGGEEVGEGKREGKDEDGEGRVRKKRKV